jgi:hypothetical protein
MAGEPSREVAIEAAGWFLGEALSDMNGSAIDRLVHDGISLAYLGVEGGAAALIHPGYTEEELAQDVHVTDVLERLDGLPYEAGVAAEAGFAVAALLAGYSERIGLGLAPEDCARFARAATNAAVDSLLEDDAPCSDCGALTLSAEPGARNEWYAVTDEVWAAAGLGSGYLCVGCLEARLGRRLRPEDFKDIPGGLNDLAIADDRYSWSWRSERLTARLRGEEL